MRKKRIGVVLKQLCCVLLCLIVIAPFYMVVINSFKPKAEAARMSLSLPTKWMFSNYIEVIEKGKLIQGFFNSLQYAVIATIIGVIGAAMAAYVMSRRRTRLKIGRAHV